MQLNSSANVTATDWALDDVWFTYNGEVHGYTSNVGDIYNHTYDAPNNLTIEYECHAQDVQGNQATKFGGLLTQCDECSYELFGKGSFDIMAIVRCWESWFGGVLP